MSASIGAPASGRSAVAGALVAQRAPGGQRRFEALAAQAAPQLRELAGAPALQQAAQRLEVRGALARERRDELVPLEQLDVEVAHGPGQRLHPPELGPQMGALAGVVHALELAQHRARAPDRHAQVVEELGVEVGERAGDVGLGDLGQPREHLRGGSVRARAGGELDARLGGEAVGAPADGLDRLVVDVAPGGLEAEPVAQDAQRPLVLVVVAEHRLHDEPRGERNPLRGLDRLGALDHQPHHGLGVAVEHRHRDDRAADPHHREERALLEHAGQPPAHRPRRQLARQVAAGGLDVRAPRRRARLVDGEQRPGTTPGRPLRAQARRPQATVGAVEQDAVLGVRAAHVELEALGEQGDRGGTVERGREQQLGRRRRHAA